MATGMIGAVTDGIGGLVNEDRVRLAVTGLSRAGKTVFITSIIHNLLALPHANTLPGLSARLLQNGRSRLRDVRVLPAGAGVLPFFDYGSKLSGLAADTPVWPPRTEDLAQISLALEVERSSSLGRRLGPRRIRLDILDYPGEWLLDLPMLGQSYAEWSTQAMSLLSTPPRDASCAAFLEFVSGLRPDDRAEEALLHKAHLLYRDGLHACRREHGLRYLQPGRFICPGPYSDAPYMWFFPMVATAKGRRGDTWAHWQLALSYARHLSPAFHAWCNSVVRDAIERSGGLPHEGDALMVFVENQFEQVHRRLDHLNQHAADQMFLLVSTQELMLDQRRNFSERSRALICKVISAEPYEGHCPCCHAALVLTPDRQPAEGAEYDHFFHRALNRPEHGWLICRRCHSELTFGVYLVRFSRMPEFRRFQAAVSWIEQARVSLIAPLARAVAKDVAAIRAAIIEPWSNGQTEGQITRLKLVKRQMYGRAKLDLLEARLVGPA